MWLLWVLVVGMIVQLQVEIWLLKRIVARLELDQIKTDADAKYNGGFCEGRAKTFDEARKEG